MTGKSIGLSLNPGFAGQPSRETPIPEIFSLPAGEDIAFGAPLALVNGTYVLLKTANVASMKANDFAGICARSVMQSQIYTSQNGETGYKENQPACALKKGFVTILTAGTPTAGGNVYIVKSTGAFTATADGSNTLLLANARFTTGQKGTNNSAEIEVLYPMGPVHPETDIST